MTTSRVFRQIITVEVIAVVEPDGPAPGDKEGIGDATDYVMDGIAQMNAPHTYTVAGERKGTEWEELKA